MDIKLKIKVKEELCKCKCFDFGGFFCKIIMFDFFNWGFFYYSEFFNNSYNINLWMIFI